MMPLVSVAVPSLKKAITACAPPSHFLFRDEIRVQLHMRDGLTEFQQSNEDSSADVTAAVEELLNSLSNKFAGVSSEIFAKSE